MTARDDHAARVMAGVSEPQCWAALFDEIDALRAALSVASGVGLRFVEMPQPDGSE